MRWFYWKAPKLSALKNERTKRQSLLLSVRLVLGNGHLGCLYCLKRLDCCDYLIHGYATS